MRVLKCNKAVSICGEMAGDIKLTRLLLGLGLRIFSMHPAHILAAKKQVLQSDLAKITPSARKILASHDMDKIEPLLQKLNLS